MIAPKLRLFLIKRQALDRFEYRLDPDNFPYMNDCSDDCMIEEAFAWDGDDDEDYWEDLNGEWNDLCDTMSNFNIDDILNDFRSLHSYDTL